MEQQHIISMINVAPVICCFLPARRSGLLFTCPGIGEYISGAILYEETLFQNNADGTPFVDCLKKSGIIPGIKVDTGLVPLPGGHEVETWCSGLDGLVERCQKYYAQGARFAKWRAVLQITSDGAPTNLSIQENAWGLARYARAAQEAGLVPIVEPEILMDGDHTVPRTAEVQEKVSMLRLMAQSQLIVVPLWLFRVATSVQAAFNGTIPQAPVCSCDLVIGAPFLCTS